MIIKCPHCQQDHEFNYGQYMAAKRQAKPNPARAEASRANGLKRKPAYKIEISHDVKNDNWRWRVFVKRKIVSGGICDSKKDAANCAKIAIKDLIDRAKLVTVPAMSRQIEVVPAPKGVDVSGQMYYTISDNDCVEHEAIPFVTLNEVSAAFRKVIEANNQRAEEAGTCTIWQDNKPVAYVSYNGKVWKGEFWKSDAELLYEPDYAPAK